MKKNQVKVGDCFGCYTIISEPFKEGKYYKIKAKCQCGHIKTTYLCNVKRLSKCKSCNAKEKYRKYKSGDKVNYLTVIDYCPYVKDRSSKLKVICDCGEIFETFAFPIAQSCGCKNKKGITHNSYKGTSDIPKTYFTLVKYNAEKKNRQFSITINDMQNVFTSQKGKCALSGQDISIHNKKNASLDRIDSSKGYIKNNIQWIHKDINRMKSDFDQKYFLEICSKIHSNNNPQFGI